MAIIDARELSADHRIEADLCIIGSGAAGLALASALAGRRLSVAILESGGLEPNDETTRLNAGEIVGLPDYPLDQSRLRFFGGTTNHWTAWVRPFEAIDFEARDWIPHSGWPFSGDALAAHYERARTFLGLPRQSFAVEHWTTPGAYPLAFEENRVESRVLQIVPDPRRKLGIQLRSMVTRATNLTVYLHANVLDIVPNEAATRVHALRIATGAKRRASAHAGRYVLAAGGIENARLLLLSSNVTAHGLGNDKDLVGRFFANHPESGVAARIELTDVDSTTRFYLPKKHVSGTTRGFLRLRDDIQRAERVANCWLQPTISRGARATTSKPAGHGAPVAKTSQSDDPMDASVTSAIHQLDAGLRAGTAPGTGASRARARRMFLKGFVEPTPNPASRVRLGDGRDAFGKRQVALDWRLSPLDARHLHETIGRVAHEVGASGLGRLQSLFPAGGYDAVDHRGSFHHMGTTRMHRSAAMGVVDADCRVHGIANLYVAGSSVFPTYGTANPTFTILALAFRLADHLTGQST